MLIFEGILILVVVKVNKYAVATEDCAIRGWSILFNNLSLAMECYVLK